MALIPVMALSLGCPDGDGEDEDEPIVPEAAPLDPDDAVWEGTTLSIGEASASFHMAGSRDNDPLVLNVYVNDVPPGTKVDVEGTTGTADQFNSVSLAVDMRPRIGALSLREVDSQADLGVTVKIEAPETEVIEETVPDMRVRSAVGAALARTRDGPVVFEGEPEHDGSVSAVALVDAGSSVGDVTVVGSADKVQDLDWVAVIESEDSGRRETCEGYDDPDDEGEEISIQVAQHDAEVTIYERRTGEKVVSNTFEPERPCPSFAYVRDGEARARVHDRQIEPWLRDHLEEARQR